MAKPENPTHTDLWERLEAAEHRQLKALTWGIGIAITLFGVFGGWYVNAAGRQDDVNRMAAERFGEAREAQGRISEQLKSLESIVRENHRDMQEILQRHIENPNAHQGRLSGGPRDE